MAQIQNQRNKHRQSGKSVEAQRNTLKQQSGKEKNDLMTGSITAPEDMIYENEENNTELDSNESTDINDEESMIDDFEMNHEPDDVQNIFEYEPSSNTATISQKKNVLFLRKNENGMKIYISAHLRRHVVTAEKNWMAEVDTGKKDKLFHKFSKPLFVEKVGNVLQEYLNGFYDFEVDGFGLRELKSIIPSKQLSEEFKEDSDNVRKWVKNLSVQMDNGFLFSFNILTPNGSKYPKRDYVILRRAIGRDSELKKQFYDLMLSQSDRRFNKDFERFCRKIGIEGNGISKLRDKNEDFLSLKEFFYAKAED